MGEASNTVLVALLVVYAGGALWVVGLLWVTIMKFTGWIEIKRPRWLFGSIHRAIFAVLVSAAALIGLDTVMRAAGVL